jgi:hypothetical protein
MCNRAYTQSVGTALHLLPNTLKLLPRHRSPETVLTTMRMADTAVRPPELDA